MAKGYREMLAAAEAIVETLTVDAARRHLELTETVFVDLRDVRELEREGMIPGAEHCPRGMLEFWIDPESPYHMPLFAEPRFFLFYCAAGWRSALAARTALEMGLTRSAHLGGGFNAWSEAGAPTVTRAENAALRRARDTSD